MAKEFELQVAGREAMIANFHRKDAIVQRSLKRINRETAQDIYKRVDEYCPVDTGFMRDHIRKDVTDFSFSVGWAADDFFSEGFVFYPEFVEFGTRMMAGRFPLTRAYNEVYPKHLQRISRSVKAAIERDSE